MKIPVSRPTLYKRIQRAALKNGFTLRGKFSREDLWYLVRDGEVVARFEGLQTLANYFGALQDCEEVVE